MTEPAPQLRSLLRLGRYFRPYRAAFLLLAMGLTVESVYEVATRYSFKFIIDQAIIPGDYAQLGLLLGLLAGGGVVYAVAVVGADYLWAKYGLLVINDLRHDLFVHLQSLSLGFFHRQRGGDLASRFMADMARIEDGVLYAIPMGASGLLQVGLSLVLMAGMNPTLFVIGVIGLAISVGSPKIVNARALAAGYAFRSNEGQLAAHVQDNISAQSVIKAYGLERKAAADFRSELTRLMRFGLRSYFLSSMTQRVPTLLFVLIHLVIFGVGAGMVIGGTLTIGALMAFHAMFLGLGTSINNVAWLMPSLIDATASFRRINEVFDEISVASDPPGAVDLAPMTTGIVFEAVRFGYSPEADVIHDLSLTLNQGDYVALVGPTGAGKTTLANLLLRFVEPDHGAIRIDGTDIRRVRLDSLRRRIGLVQQETVLFRTSIRENIRAGRLDADDGEIEAAAEAAGLHSFILGLPQGYDTVYGVEGRRFSGGECQRIALARALVRRPDILLLDEATSSLDTTTEAAILATIRSLQGRCTILAITHRLAMARQADRILVLSDGRLAEDGSHDLLMDAGGLYATLWRDRAVDDA